jgi:hypothetical protein
MRPDILAWLATVRAEAEVPGTIAVVLGPPRRQISIPPQDIVGKPDDELLAFIAGRLAEH